MATRKPAMKLPSIFLGLAMNKKSNDEISGNFSWQKSNLLMALNKYKAEGQFSCFGSRKRSSWFIFLRIMARAAAADEYTPIHFKCCCFTTWPWWPSLAVLTSDDKWLYCSRAIGTNSR